MIKAIKKCRVCGNKKFIEICNLGNQFLTGVFPRINEKVARSPLELIQCKKCKLIQLRHTFSLEAMYGLNYGYRSSLNGSMVGHLKGLVSKIRQKIRLEENDVIIDIGGNDGTFLKLFPHKLKKIAIDPTIKKFQKYYNYNDDKIVTFSEFFPSQNLDSFLDKKRAKLITSIACFYDLERPVEFMKEIYRNLEDGGLWVFEQSYLPDMIKTLSYDMVCHEHLEYYHLGIIRKMCEMSGFKIVDVSFNDTNGGSFCVMAGKESSKHKKFDTSEIEKEEERLFNSEDFLLFQERIDLHKKELLEVLDICKAQGYRLGGFGASTKGNVLLQYCGIDNEILDCIAEINTDKFGCETPGTHIPIVSEEEAKERCDIFLVLPWHFRRGIINKNPNMSFIFPLPNYVETFLKIDPFALCPEEILPEEIKEERKV